MSEAILSDVDENGFSAEDMAEFIEIFVEEFETLMISYRDALIRLRSLRADKLQALEDIFRIYHTLKGGAGMFPGFEDFTEFCKEFTEQLRNPTLEFLKNEQLMKEIRLNYSRMSSAFYALNKGKNLRTFRFKIMLRNF